MKLKQIFYIAALTMNAMLSCASSSHDDNKYYALHGTATVDENGWLSENESSYARVLTFSAGGSTERIFLQSDVISMRGTELLRDMSLFVAGGMPKDTLRAEGPWEYYPPLKYFVFNPVILACCATQGLQKELLEQQFARGVQEQKSLADVVALLQALKQPEASLIIDLEAYLVQLRGPKWREFSPLKRVPLTRSAGIWGMFEAVEQFFSVDRLPYVDLKGEQDADQVEILTL